MCNVVQNVGFLLKTVNKTLELEKSNIELYSYIKGNDSREKQLGKVFTNTIVMNLFLESTNTVRNKYLLINGK